MLVQLHTGLAVPTLAHPPPMVGLLALLATTPGRPPPAAAPLSGMVERRCVHAVLPPAADPDWHLAEHAQHHRPLHPWISPASASASACHPPQTKMTAACAAAGRAAPTLGLAAAGAPLQTRAALKWPRTLEMACAGSCVCTYLCKRL